MTWSAPRWLRFSFLRPLLSHAVLLMLLISSGLNILQARQLRSLQTPAILPAIGSVAPALHVKTLDGHPVDLVLGHGRGTILYYFSPTCSWCERNWENVRALLRGTTGTYEFIGLSSRSEVRSYLNARNLSFAVYSGLSPETIAAYHFGGTPDTIIVSASGVVTHVWTGAYRGVAEHEVERVFGVPLPGVRLGTTSHP